VDQDWKEKLTYRKLLKEQLLENIIKRRKIFSFPLKKKKKKAFNFIP